MAARLPPQAIALIDRAAKHLIRSDRAERRGDSDAALVAIDEVSRLESILASYFVLAGVPADAAPARAARRIDRRYTFLVDHGPIETDRVRIRGFQAA